MMKKLLVLLAAFGFIGCATAQTRSAEIKAADGTVVVVNVDPVTRKVTAVESADAVMRGVDMVLGPAGMRGSEMSLRWHFAVFLRTDVQPKRIVVEDVTASPIRLLVDDVSPSLEGQVWAKSSRAVPLAGPLLADFNSGDFWGAIFKVSITLPNDTVTHLYQYAAYGPNTRAEMLRTALEANK